MFPLFNDAAGLGSRTTAVVAIAGFLALAVSGCSSRFDNATHHGMKVPIDPNAKVVNNCPITAGATCLSVDLSHQSLATANFVGADLRGTDFSGATLRRAAFTGANLAADSAGKVVSFAGADLSDADFHHANLQGVNLRGAILVGTQLHHAQMSGADLAGADARDAHLGDTGLTSDQLRFVEMSRLTTCPDNSQAHGDPAHC